MSKQATPVIDRNGPCIIVTPPHRTPVTKAPTMSESFRAALARMERAVMSQNGAELWDCMHAYIERKTRRELAKRQGFGLKGETAARGGAHYEEVRTAPRAVFERDGWMKKRAMDDATGETVLKSVPRWLPTGETVDVAMPWEKATAWADCMQDIACMLIEMKPLSVREKGKPARMVPLADVLQEQGRMKVYYVLVNRAYEIAVKAFGLDAPRNLPMTSGYGASSEAAEAAWFRILRDERAEAELAAAEAKADTRRMYDAGMTLLLSLHEKERAFLLDTVISGAPTDDSTSSARARMIKRLAAAAAAGALDAGTVESALSIARTWAAAM